jgi:hypothetical protein
MTICGALYLGKCPFRRGIIKNETGQIYEMAGVVGQAVPAAAS